MTEFSTEEINQGILETYRRYFSTYLLVNP